MLTKRWHELRLGWDTACRVGDCPGLLRPFLEPSLRLVGGSPREDPTVDKPLATERVAPASSELHARASNALSD
jgi:hypothetical protein